MKNNLCLCVKFCCKLGKNFTETFQLQDPIVAVDGERVSSTKKHHGWVGQRSRCCCLCFLIGKALSIMIVTRGQTVNKQLNQEVLACLRDAVRRKRPDYGRIRLGCCITTMRRLTHHSSSTVIWQNIRHPLCPIHPILQTYPRQTFSCFPNFKPL